MRAALSSSRAMRMFAAVFGAYMVLRVKRPTLRTVMPRGQVLQPELEYINF